MNKTVIMFFTIVFELLGNYLPVLIFKVDFFSLWSILGGVIGGIFGIFIGVKVSERFE